MSDLTPAERLAKLRALEEWLDWQLRDTRRKITDYEQQARATGGYVTEQERKAGHAVGITIHAATCTHIGQAAATLTEAQARFALAKDKGHMHPCTRCRPEQQLGLNEY